MNFLDLPQAVINGICGFMDIRSLERLREVSKMANVIVDSIKTMEVCRFEMKRKPFDNSMLELAIDIGRGYTFYEKFILFASEKIQFTRLEFARQVSCIHGTIARAEIGRLLVYLKPLLRRTQFQSLNILDDSDIIRKFTYILNERSVDKIKIVKNYENVEFTPWLNLIRNIKPRSIIYCMSQLTNKAADFLLSTSHYVRSMSVHIFIKNETVIDLAFLARRILSNSCASLNLSEGLSISLAGAENLLQFLHNMEKKVHFTSNFTSEPITPTQIGIYRVETFESRFGRRIAIRHIQLI